MDEFYTVNQTAITLKVHPLTVRRYIKEGRLKAYRAGGNIRISVNDIRVFTQSFIPQHRRIKTPTNTTENADTKQFSYTDPLFSLKGKGLSMSKFEEQHI